MSDIQPFSLGIGLMNQPEQSSEWSNLTSVFDALSERLLKMDYAGGNAVQAWQFPEQEKPKDISPAAYFARTGRTAPGAPMAKIKSGLETGTLTGGTSLTPKEDWDSIFPKGDFQGPTKTGEVVQGKGMQSLPFTSPLNPKPPGLLTRVGQFGIQEGKSGSSGTSIRSPYGVASVQSALQSDQNLAKKITNMGGGLVAPDAETLASQIFS